MSDKTRISWSDATWNPVRGCTKVSEGCLNCFIDRSGALTFTGPNGPDAIGARTEIELRHDLLDQPLRWTRARKIFVNSQSDLFHAGIPDSYIAAVFAVMATATQHTYQVLTKRPARMHALLGSNVFWAQVAYEMASYGSSHLEYRERQFASLERMNARPVALPNIWLGVTVEDQKAALLRVPILLDTPAAVRFLSCEPLLGEVSLTHMDVEGRADGMYWINALTGRNTDMGRPCADVAKLDWVIIGGESGDNARPMHPQWARELRDQCLRAGVAVWFKQWGDASLWTDKQHDIWTEGPDGLLHTPETAPFPREYVERKWGPLTPTSNKVAGHLIDGVLVQQFPETDLR